MPLFLALMLALGGAMAQGGDPVARGKQIYADQKCSMCHQIAGQGNKMFPLDGVAKRLPEADIRRWLTSTREMEDALPKRPAIRMSSRRFSFSDADLNALVAYLKTLK